MTRDEREALVDSLATSDDARAYRENVMERDAIIVHSLRVIALLLNEIAGQRNGGDTSGEEREEERQDRVPGAYPGTP